jgi:hypothetical protein
MTYLSNKGGEGCFSLKTFAPLGSSVPATGLAPLIGSWLLLVDEFGSQYTIILLYFDLVGRQAYFFKRTLGGVPALVS